MNAKPSAVARADDPLPQAILAALGTAATPLARPFVEHFFSRIGSEDRSAHAADAWSGMMRGLLDFVRVRKAGTPNLRVFNPVQDADGYESAHTVIDIMTDDMPFLVDSVGIAVTQAGLNLHLVAHPVYSVERDAGGNVLAFAAEGGKGKTESLMHFEIDRITDPADRARLEQSVRSALDDVAQCYRDWPAMREKMLGIADALASSKLPVDAAGVAEAQEFLRWAAADHFTFL
ncbi:MAG TPA: NAD-glutamate dehydrogenase, partial [Rudaea sp.]|nr:NAD-glutamate dehydrogenase [Rudaea sp.]